MSKFMGRKLQLDEESMEEIVRGLNEVGKVRIHPLGVLEKRTVYKKSCFRNPRTGEYEYREPEKRVRVYFKPFKKFTDRLDISE